MRRVRFALVALVAWVVLFYAADWWATGLKFTPTANVFLPATALALLLAPSLMPTRHFRLLLPALLIGLLTVKWATGELSSSSMLPITLIEGAAVAITALLARQVSLDVGALEEAVLKASGGQLGERRARYGEVYREVRRARDHQRPLSVLAVRYDGHASREALAQAVREAQAALADRYLEAKVTNVLNSALDEDHIVARQGDHFLVVLPETTAEDACTTAKHLRQAGQELAGVSLQIGAACLPEDAATLDGLVEIAIDDMRADRPVTAANGKRAVNSRPLVEVQHGHVDHQ